LTAALPRLWHLRSLPVKRRRILCHGHEAPADWFARDFIRDILTAIGLTAEDFVRLERPSAIKRLWIPRPAMEEQNFIHRAFDDLARRIGRFYGVHRQVRGDKAIYLSKSRLSVGITRFANEHKLEVYLSDRGVTVAHPQEMSFPDQLKLLAEANAICGTVGSAMHTTLFLDRPSRVVGLTGHNLVNANYVLFDKLKGNDSIYLYPEVEAAGISNQDGFNSTWTLDFHAVAEEFAARI
jgi:capsular polysaccharide biosynthesis protein